MIPPNMQRLRELTLIYRDARELLHSTRAEPSIGAGIKNQIERYFDRAAFRLASATCEELTGPMHLDGPMPHNRKPRREKHTTKNEGLFPAIASLIPVKQAAVIAGVSTKVVYSAIRNKYLKGQKIEDGLLRVHSKDLDHWIKHGCVWEA